MKLSFKIFVLSTLTLSFSTIKAQTNLLDTSNWNLGTGNIDGFTIYGPSVENERILYANPFGENEIVWVAKPSGDQTSDGGVYSPYITIDPSKTYRTSIWMKKTGSQNGGNYFGLHIQNAQGQQVAAQFWDNAANSNPYFMANSNFMELNKWYLLVAFVHPNNYSGPSLAKIYDGNTGEVVSSPNIIDYKFSPDATLLRSRALLWNNANSNDRLYFWKPTIYEVNGQEPTIQEMLDTSISVNSISLNSTSLSLEVGQSQDLLTSISPSNATNKNLNWVSSNTAVAAVGASGAVTAIAAGTTIITATTVDGGFTATSTVSVTTAGDGNPPTSSDAVWLANGEAIYYLDHVAIGRNTVPIGYKLAVDGHIRAREIKVDAESWPDYVFNTDYKLLSLEEIENYIHENGHLPNIPNANEVEKNGVDLGEMNKLLLEKIEELMLYTIKQQRELDMLKRSIEEPKSE